MSRQYVVPFSKKADTAIVDIFEIAPAANKNIELVGLFIAQTSDFGDAQAEIIPYRIVRGHATSGSGGEGITPSPIDPSDVAAAFTAETMNTTIASTGTPIICHSSAFHIATGEALWWPEGCGPKCTSTQSRIVLRNETAPVDELLLSGCLYVREV